MKKGQSYGKLQSKFIGLASVLWLEVSFVEVRYNTCEVLLMFERNSPSCCFSSLLFCIFCSMLSLYRVHSYS